MRGAAKGCARKRRQMSCASSRSFIARRFFRTGYESEFRAFARWGSWNSLPSGRHIEIDCHTNCYQADRGLESWIDLSVYRVFVVSGAVVAKAFVNATAVIEIGEAIDEAIAI
jgi:hypothetical protein